MVLDVTVITPIKKNLMQTFCEDQVLLRIEVGSAECKYRLAGSKRFCERKILQLSYREMTTETDVRVCGTELATQRIEQTQGVYVCDTAMGSSSETIS